MKNIVFDLGVLNKFETEKIFCLRISDGIRNIFFRLKFFEYVEKKI